MRIYMDNCCFNRPFDDQSQLRVRIETEAKLYIQQKVFDGKLELVWSYILEYENNLNPFRERKMAIKKWKSRAKIDVGESPSVIRSACDFKKFGIRAIDALHLACAVTAKSLCFLTTDDLLIRKLQDYRGVRVLNPAAFVIGE